MTVHPRGVGVGAALSAGVFVLLAGLGETPTRPALAASVAVLVAAWWFLEAWPAWVTGLVPLLAFPVLGVFEGDVGGRLKQAVEPYGNAYILLFIGGMVLGAATEACGLHRRAALHVLQAIGTSPRRLVLGVLVATAATSMWISNTATAVMMLPIGLALVGQLERTEGRRLDGFAAAVMLAIAWGANLGGIGTKIGTGTNSIFLGYLADRLSFEVSFARYLLVGVPFLLLTLPVAFGLLGRGLPSSGGDAAGAAVIREELRALGAMTRRERIVGAVFAAAAVAWVFGDLLRPLVTPWIPSGFSFQARHYEAAVALSAGGLVLLLGQVDVPTLRRVQWSVLLLLGGSFALAAGVEASGLSAILSASLSTMGSWPAWLQVLVAAGATVVLSAFASNTATVNVALTVLPQRVALLVTCGIAASCDFALPAGTPPNAIVFGSGRVRVREMMRTGVLLDLACVALLVPFGLWWVPFVLGSD